MTSTLAYTHTHTRSFQPQSKENLVNDGCDVFPVKFFDVFAAIDQPLVALRTVKYFKKLTRQRNLTFPPSILILRHASLSVFYTHTHKESAKE